MNQLNFTSLAKAIASLAGALQAASERPRDEFVRDAQDAQVRLHKASR